MRGIQWTTGKVGKLSLRGILDDPRLARRQLTTMRRSPPSTWAGSVTATRRTVPAFGAVIAASIFIASMVAMVCPAVTVSSTETLTLTTPAKGAAM